jgi:HEPN domain-containing protein
VSYNVFIRLDQGEREALYPQATKALAPTTFAFTESEGEEPDELALTVEAGSPEIAVSSATDTYMRLRESAGLGFREPAPLFVVAGGGLFAAPRHFEFYALADDLVQRGECRFAVVAAQTACELYLEVAVTELLKARLQEPFTSLVPDLLQTFSMLDQRGPKVWRALTGQRIQDAPCWANYQRHVQRRNTIVHSGAEPTRDEALASVGAMMALFEYVAAAWTANP